MSSTPLNISSILDCANAAELTKPIGTLLWCMQQSDFQGELCKKNNHEPCTCKGRKSVSVGSVRLSMRARQKKTTMNHAPVSGERV